MTPLFDAALRSWPFDPWLTAGLLLSAAIYFRGWRVYHRRDLERWTFTRLIAFLAGLASIFLALASPIEVFASLLLTVHMVQHLLLMMAAPPLIWASAPLLPLLRGLPEPVRTYWIAPLFRVAWLRKLASSLTHPVTALVLFTITTWAWHSPRAYQLALESPAWHYVQHVCFLAAGLLFWFPVVRPYPLKPRWPVWLLLPVLILADLSNTALSALLCFSDRVLYPHYTNVPSIDGGNALDDQAAAGVLMWVPGSIAYLLPLFAIGLRLLFGETETPRVKLRVQQNGRVSLPMLSQAKTVNMRFDLLRLPVLGAFLRWRHSRVALQVPMLLLAIAMVLDGFTGSEAAPMNLAGVLPWIHWRGLLILALLIGGNFFCTACPFMLPRTVSRKLLPAGMAWPRWLRSKWLAVGLLTVFFTAYEAFSLWDDPRLTAFIVIAYFLAAFTVDGLFRGASFCKYVCPIGQFNFVQSLASPLEVAVRNPAICASCRTKDCIRGRDEIPGCELGLFQPRKHGNMDCTFCLDCVHACPHDNIGITGRKPGSDLTSDPHRSGIGRFGKRKDIAALIVVLVFAAFTNAAGMVGPVQEWRVEMQQRLTFEFTWLFTAGLYLLSLTVIPAVCVLSTAWISRTAAGLKIPTIRIATRFAAALMPLGFAMWAAHYGYHLATSYETAWPVTQQFAERFGTTPLGEPEWSCCCCGGVWNGLLGVEIVILDFGLLLSLYVAYRIAKEVTPNRTQFVPVWLPWAVLVIGLFAMGVWILLQPMQMRGTLIG